MCGGYLHRNDQKTQNCTEFVAMTRQSQACANTSGHLDPFGPMYVGQIPCTQQQQMTTSPPTACNCYAKFLMFLPIFKDVPTQADGGLLWMPTCARGLRYFGYIAVSAAKTMLSAYTFWPQSCPRTVGRWANNVLFLSPRVFLAENVRPLVVLPPHMRAYVGCVSPTSRGRKSNLIKTRKNQILFRRPRPKQGGAR